MDIIGEHLKVTKDFDEHTYKLVCPNIATLIDNYIIGRSLYEHRTLRLANGWLSSASNVGISAVCNQS